MNWFEEAMRDWRKGLSSPRLWVVCFLTAALFAAIGPAGTGEVYGPAGRAAFWGAGMAAAWVATTFTVCLAEARLGPRPLASLLAGVALATPLLLLMAPAHASLMHRDFGLAEAAVAAPLCALLATVIVVKTRLALGQPLGFGALTGEGAPAPAPAFAASASAASASAAPAASARQAAPRPAAPTPVAAAESPAPDSARSPEPTAGPAASAAPAPQDPPAAPSPAVPSPAPSAEAPPADGGVIAFAAPARRPAPAILRRLPQRKRGALLRLSMSDHYVGVATEHGEEMLLMRLSDAIAETAPEEGLKVHRSHWVARRAVRAVEPEGDRATLVLTNGERIPVSRTRMQVLRTAGWLSKDAPRFLALGEADSADRAG
ncbi:LytTR family DNA-binding domain-containing protein [Albimonas pacifica]|uniref:LytTr DNA-binding domain-containing protein n=1 Tax=Albimonas pacifica TaxID=1114924 RepID=A0A1I3J4L2_9RHOB|nr:LytTR family DNA-binding domain-containing protein [Albimonas pacifica]SFI55046.1 LytTr DNA-binding domain-containing protein [Albimonas pacifica]